MVSLLPLKGARKGLDEQYLDLEEEGSGGRKAYWARAVG
jgi:hypothetical protein